MAELVALAVATMLLVAIPGPNVALIAATSARFGVGKGVVTVVGTTCGVAAQVAVVAGGMVVVVDQVAGALDLIRWAGVTYLLWLGIRAWRASADDIDTIPAAPLLFWRGCIVAAINPKTLLFHAAFIPQFVTGQGGPAAEFAVVAGVFLGVLFLGDLAWALAAARAATWLRRFSRVRNRLTGGLFIAAGVGLAVSRRSV